MSVLQNAARVLKCFGTDTPDITVSEVVRRLDMPKANASRLLKAMRDSGMLETIGTTYRHRPGSLLLDVAAHYRRSSPLITKACEAVAGVTEEFGHTGYISIRDGLEVTAVADFEGTNALRVVSNIGRRLPAHQSATGRTLLARLSDDAAQDLYAGHPAAQALPECLAEIRRRGFALSSQETTPGVDAIAIAVCDPSTAETLSLCIVYPHGLVDAEGRDRMVAALGDRAARIAADLGDTQFVPPRI